MESYKELGEIAYGLRVSNIPITKESILSLFPNISYLQLHGIMILDEDWKVYPEKLDHLKLSDCRVRTIFLKNWLNKLEDELTLHVDHLLDVDCSQDKFYFRHLLGLQMHQMNE